MSGRKEQRERLREERLAAQRAAQTSDKRRLYLGYAVAGVIVVAIIAGIVVAIGGTSNTTGVDSQGNAFPDLAYIQDTSGAVPDGIKTDGRDGTDPPPLAQGDLQTAADDAGCDLMLDLPDEGNTHIQDEFAKDVNYKTNPPTSGDHFASPTETASGALAAGAYREYPPVGRVVHAMEHGRVEIQYSPDLPEEDQLAIKGVFEESPQSVVLFPNPNMPYEVAVTAWTQLAGCDKFEGRATLDTIRDFRDTYRGLGPEPFPING
jgi:hypothetical protein